MHFAQLIADKNDQDFEAERQKVMDEDAHKIETAAVRHELVVDKIRQFAEVHSMEYLELSSIRPNLFMVGGFVFTVRLHERVDKSQLDSVERSKVLWQYCVRLVGFDRTDRTTEALVGTLAVLNAESVRDAFNKAGTQWIFDAQGVIALLASKSSD